MGVFGLIGSLPLLMLFLVLSLLVRKLDSTSLSRFKKKKNRDLKPAEEKNERHKQRKVETNGKKELCLISEITASTEGMIWLGDVYSIWWWCCIQESRQFSYWTNVGDVEEIWAIQREETAMTIENIGCSYIDF